jgi:hypothetical protein
MEKEKESSSIQSQKIPFLSRATNQLTNKQGTITLILFAVAFVFSLCMATPLSPLLSVDDNIFTAYSQPLYTMTAPVDRFTIICAIGCVVALMYNLMRNNSRRIYYPSNIVISLITFAYTIVGGCFAISTSKLLQEQFEEYVYADFINTKIINTADPMRAYTFKGTSTMASSSFVPTIGYIIGALFFVHAAFIAYELFMKIVSGQQIKKQIYAEPVKADPAAEEGK